MKDFSQPHHPALIPRTALQLALDEMLQELYFSKIAIAESFIEIEDQICSSQLETIFKNHYNINLTHKERLEKVFKSLNTAVEPKKCGTVSDILTQAKDNLNRCLHDKIKWEITLIITSRKLARYKITSYGVATHLALILNHTQAATLLAISAQEEEEFIEKSLDDITHEFFKTQPGRI